MHDGRRSILRKEAPRITRINRMRDRYIRGDTVDGSAFSDTDDTFHKAFNAMAERRNSRRQTQANTG